MSTLDKTTRALAAGHSMKPVALLFGALLAAMLSAAAFAAGSEGEGELVKAAMQTKRDVRSGGYELRCWQEGRLILQENYLQPAADSAADVLRMNDRNGQRVRLLETKNATCLLKKVSAPRRMLRP